MKSNKHIHRGLAGLCVFTFCVLTSGQAMASGTWGGGGADSKWSKSNIFSGNAVPFGPNPIPYTFAGNVKNTSNNDLTGLVSAAFAFTNDNTGIDTNAFVLGGNSITLGVGRSITTTITTGSITDTINPNHHLTVNGNISETLLSGITKNGSGILTLSGNNTYTGATLLQAGTISLSSIADGGSGSNIGSGTSMRIGNLGITATLNYTGSGSTTARTVQKFNSGSY